MNSPRIESLVLDAGPLLSLAPLRGVSKRYFTVPQVLGELKDERSRTHLENLGLSAGVNVETRSPDMLSLSKVTLAAKKSGDYSVLSAADLHVLALTYALHQELQSRTIPEQSSVTKEPKEDKPTSEIPTETNSNEPTIETIEKPLIDTQDDEEVNKLSKEFERLPLDEANDEPVEQLEDPDTPLYDDPSDEDDGEGDWITPGNVGLKKSRALDLLPDETTKRRKQDEGKILVGCMTADYAMQNVLLHMGLNLVNVDGSRISTVKSWVLRCHACFKICKDSSKKFCPSCGNPSLLRTSISTTAPKKPGEAPIVQIHLKKNFQYRTRGTKYAIPMPKPGNSKTGSGTGIVLREDQIEFMRAAEKEARRERREEEKLIKAVASDPKADGTVKIGNWTDPDWIPDMLVGSGRRNDSHGLPAIGMGKRNPNERRKKR